MTQVKICGLQPGDDLSFAASPVVTHTGIVFVPGSRRYVHPIEAASMTPVLRKHTVVMGVFVDTPTSVVLETLRQAGAAGAQLHGKESPEECKVLRDAGIVVWKALFAPAASEQWSALSAVIVEYQTAVDAILIDAPPPKGANANVTGGHGRPFDWGDLPKLASALHPAAPPVWVAGGITPDNVHTLLGAFPAAGVDVSSGVEQNGRKSPAKIQAILEAVTRHE